MRAKLESVKRQTGRDIPELDELLTLPASMEQVWYWFVSLNNARSSNGFGVNPIQYSEMKAYFDLINVEPEEWEVNTIKQLDIVAMQIFADQQKREQEKQKTKK